MVARMLISHMYMQTTSLGPSERLTMMVRSCLCLWMSRNLRQRRNLRLNNDLGNGVFGGVRNGEVNRCAAEFGEFFGGFAGDM